MNKTIELTGREQQLVREALLRTYGDKKRLSQSDDPGIASIGRMVARELMTIIDKVERAELA